MHPQRPVHSQQTQVSLDNNREQKYTSVRLVP